MRPFEILFDHGEPGEMEDAAYGSYGWLGFPPPPPEGPWIFSNFVQSLDGIASLKGKCSAGSHISQSREDHWLMELLRAHADAVILGINTLVEETALLGGRGPVYRVEDAHLRGLRQRIGRGREINVVVTGAAALDLSDYRVFDGEHVDAVVITTRRGAARLQEKKTHPQVRIIVAGETELVDLPQAVAALGQELGVRYLLCEGGPTLNGYMARAGLIDERFITISPVEFGLMVPPEQEPTEAEKQNPPRYRPTSFMAPGFTMETAPRWRWLSCRKVGDHQFNRYRRRG
jgi:riboflavin biosynthesis pyrimidine reductase